MEVYKYKGALSEAEQYFKALLANDSMNAYKATKNLDGAIDYLSGLAHTKLRNAGAYYGLGYAYRLLRQWENALMALDKALTLNPDLLEAHIEKTTIYFYLGKLYEGLEVTTTGYEIAKRNNDIELQHRFLGERGAFLQRLGGNLVKH